MATIRDVLQALPCVVAKRLNAREGFFTAGRMFALLGEDSLLLRLSIPAGTELVESDRGRRLVEPRIPVPLTWVAVPLDTDIDEVRRLAAESHEAIRLATRRGRYRVPQRRRSGFPPA